jgi:hypothetical protein
MSMPPRFIGHTMATGLFDTPVSVEDVPAEAEDYRALSGTAVAAFALALLAPLAFFDWWLLVVPVVGLIFAVVALTDIARRPTALTGRPFAIASAALSSLCLVGAVAWLSVVYATELPPGHERLNYALLQPATGDTPDRIPETAVAFHGKDVLIKGYMYPGNRQRGIIQFLLVRDQGDCCFGGNPKITDRILVQMADQPGIDYSPRMRKLAGKFRIEPTGTSTLDGGVLYHLDDARLR